MSVITNNFANAELMAKEAETIPAFNGLNLYYIKEKVTEILQHIGKDGIFSEYTLHDISHINTMLESLDWIIPNNTQKIMTATDWLLIVLSIYFHDMGMLVTRDEFEKRNQSEFANFKTTMEKNENYNELNSKLKLFSEEKRDKYLYQEFVRKNHATRIRLWIEGNINIEFGVSEQIVNEIRELLRPLGEEFRQDLATVCESHHLDDLIDFDKYPISKPYANNKDSTANVQYAAIILRTADLLHVTQNRTPSVSSFGPISGFAPNWLI